MPTWIQAVLAAAALVTALGVLWQKVFLPGFRAANRADKLIETVNRVEKMLPELTSVAGQLGVATELLPVIKTIAAEFKSDSGSTLKDQLNGMEADAAELGRIVGELREQVARMASGDADVATDLAVAKEAVEGVASDLATERAARQKDKP